MRFCVHGGPLRLIDDGHLLHLESGGASIGANRETAIRN
jgi:hypothetical protein